MDTRALLDELREMGSEKTRATYRRHGIASDQFGVSYADLGKLKKRVKTDHAAAQGLWASGNHDARILATMVGDAGSVTAGELDRWAETADNYVQADAVAGFAARTPSARRCMEAWMRAPGEWTARAGWRVLAELARDKAPADDAFFLPFLTVIEREVHGERNRVREAMNGALIAIGARSDALEAAAVAASRRMGPVQVDHGDTGCKTPDPEAYIQKTRARRR